MAVQNGRGQCFIVPVGGSRRYAANGGPHRSAGPASGTYPSTALMVIVFGEPIDPATLTGSSVQLKQGRDPGPGHCDRR